MKAKCRIGDDEWRLERELADAARIAPDDRERVQGLLRHVAQVKLALELKHLYYEFPGLYWHSRQRVAIEHDRAEFTRLANQLLALLDPLDPPPA